MSVGAKCDAVMIIEFNFSKISWLFVATTFVFWWQVSNVADRDSSCVVSSHYCLRNESGQEVDLHSLKQSIEYPWVCSLVLRSFPHKPSITSSAPVSGILKHYQDIQRPLAWLGV